MRHLKPTLVLFLALLCSGISRAQTTATITGTIKDLAQNVVPAGKITFTLKPSVDTTISGTARFISQTITCGISQTGTVVNWVNSAPGSGACIITMNAALTPTGTYYTVNICAYYSCPQGAVFNFYAYTSSIDISTITPTPTTAPNYSAGVGAGGLLVPIPVTWSATPSFASAVPSMFVITLTGNVTGSTFPTTGVVAGLIFDFQIIEDAVGGRSFVWPGNVFGTCQIDAAALPNTVYMQEVIYLGNGNYQAMAPCVIQP